MDKRRLPPAAAIKKVVAENIITLSISLIYIVLFALNTFAGENAVFNALSGSGFHKLNGQLYRVFTASFLHSNLLHLGGNIAALICVGSFLEKRLGALRMLCLFLLCGLLASLLFYGYFPECTGGNGSSIVIYALFAVLLTLWLRFPREFLFKRYDPALIYILLYFVLANIVTGGHYTTVIIHTFGFFSGLAVSLIGIKFGQLPGTVQEDGAAKQP